MRSLRWLPVGVVAGVLFAFSCGPTAKGCGPDTCQGCCDERGACLSGTGLLACGLGGGACVACSANETCQAGACGLIEGGDYDASFPDRPDAGIRYDAGTYRPDGGSPVDAGSGEDGGPAVVSFSTHIQPIFENNCSACHAWSYSSTVNAMTTCGGAGGVYIAPNNPTSSRLYAKVAGTPPCGSPMPLNGSPLSLQELDLLRRWILQGAPNN